MIFDQRIDYISNNIIILHQKKSNMSSEETQRLIEIVKYDLEHPRSEEAIKKTFQSAGIIDKNGNILAPYDQVFISSK